MNEKLIELIAHFEGIKLESYLCPAGIWTIGVGTTRYPDGEKVQKGDVITEEYANECLMHDLNVFITGVKNYITSRTNENQRAALVSFAYNLGLGALAKSTLLKKVNADPNDPTIGDEFEKWDMAGGKHVKGLSRRRRSESWLYLYGELKFDFDEV